MKIIYIGYLILFTFLSCFLSCVKSREALNQALVVSEDSDDEEDFDDAKDSDNIKNVENSQNPSINEYIPTIVKDDNIVSISENKGTKNALTNALIVAHAKANDADTTLRKAIIVSANLYHTTDDLKAARIAYLKILKDASSASHMLTIALKDCNTNITMKNAKNALKTDAFLIAFNKALSIAENTAASDIIVANAEDAMKAHLPIAMDFLKYYQAAYNSAYESVDKHTKNALKNYEMADEKMKIADASDDQDAYEDAKHAADIARELYKSAYESVNKEMQKALKSYENIKIAYEANFNILIDAMKIYKNALKNDAYTLTNAKNALNNAIKNSTTSTLLKDYDNAYNECL